MPKTIRETNSLLDLFQLRTEERREHPPIDNFWNYRESIRQEESIREYGLRGISNYITPARGDLWPPYLLDID